jgi:putative transposase
LGVRNPSRFLGRLFNRSIVARLARLAVKPLYIEPGSSWENGYVERFNDKFHYELLDAEIVYSLKEARIVIEQWRNFYNHKRPHCALGYRPLAPQGCWPTLLAIPNTH